MAEKKIKVGYTCGVYDLFHVGHLNLFERCKKHCDYLIVGICDDEYVRKVKNKEPVINENDRMRIVGALKCVDRVELINTEETVDKFLVMKRFKYDVLFAGDDWKGTERFKATQKQFEENGVDVEIVFFPYTQGVSTSALREHLKD